MRWRFGLALIGLIAIVLTCSAFLEGDITITNSSEWAVAGGNPIDINLKVENSSLSGSQLAVTKITVSIVESGYGKIIPTSDFLGSDGSLSFKFTPELLKGTIHIEFLIYYNETYQITIPYTQKIDHAEPKYYSQILYPPHQTVNQSVSIEIQLTDAYGNGIDNIYERQYKLQNHSLKYSVSELTDGGFYESRQKTIQINVTDDGYANTTYYLSSISGNNVILVVAPVTVISNTRWISIRGVHDDPVTFSSSITSSIDLDPDDDKNIALPNNKDVFKIYYYVRDKYGNPINNITIHWQSSIEGSIIIDEYFITNDFGYVYLEYGPSSKVQTITITATAVGYDFDPIIDLLEFKPTGKDLFSVRANPQIIASRNVSEQNKYSNTTVEARLIDAAGNPILNQSISFKIGNETAINGTINRSSSFDISAIVSTTSAITDINGFARVFYYAPEFPHRGESGYEYGARGVATITAEWIGSGPFINQGDIASTDVYFRSYPFLRSEVSIEPPSVERGKLINITIALIGDGYIPRKPVDVLFVNSRGPSMLKGFPDPMIYTRSAGKIILDYLNVGPDTKKDDRAGLWTFSDKGYSDLANCTRNWMTDVGDDQGGCKPNEPGYKDYVELNYPGSPRNFIDYTTCETGNLINRALDTNEQIIQRAMDNTTPWEDGQSVVHASPLRYALYKSITDINTTGRPHNQVVRAIVVLIDDNYKWFGTPLADSGSGYDWDENDIKNPGPGENWAKFPPNGPYTGKWADPNTATSWQNMSNYAKDNNIRIYVVGYATGFSASIVKKYDTLTKSTDGFFRQPSNPDELEEVYRDIAEDLMVPASVNTEMDINFESIYWSDVEGLPHNNAAKENFTYLPVQRYSTNVNSIWINPPKPFVDLLPVVPFGPYPNNTDQNYPCDGKICTKYDYWMNQSTQWNDDRQLEFYVGNISIGQKWIAKFTLNASDVGCFNIINGSDLCPVKYTSEEASESCTPYCCVPLPDSTVCVYGEGAQTPLIPTPMEIECLPPLNLNPDNIVNVTDLIDIPWRLRYDGNGSITQKIFIKYDPKNTSLIDASCEDAGWEKVTQLTLPGRGPYNLTNVTTLDLRDRYGFFKVSIRGEEILYPTGVGHTPCIVCPYMIQNEDKGKIRIY